VLSIEERRAAIERDGAVLSVARQCELLELNRSTLYYEPRVEDALNIKLMNIIDQVHTDEPCYGYRKMTELLQRDGHEVNRKRVARLMKVMGVSALYCTKKPNLSAPGHKIYPYLIRGMEICRPNQVWGVDITYIRMRSGFLYLVAILDWFSRYVLAWRLSNSLEVSFCVDALQAALKIATPEIHNSDQGSQFGSADYTRLLDQSKVAISMDGRGRAFDNIFTERLWRTVKYEEVYLKDYAGGREAQSSLGNYFERYNTMRPHQSLEYFTPAEVYEGKKKTSLLLKQKISPHGGKQATLGAIAPSVEDHHLSLGSEWS